MAQLPTPGGDNGSWGDILNDFLLVAHKADGTLQGSALNTAGAVMTANNLSDLQSAAVARTNLGLAAPQYSAVLLAETFRHIAEPYCRQGKWH